MGWDVEEPKKKDNGDKTLKILIVFIIILIILIGILLAALYYVKANTFVFSVDGKSKQITSKLMQEYNGTTFYNIQEMANLLGCDFHAGGEYKEYAKDDDKCYIVNQNETASFYLNSNKVCKVKVGEYTEDYKTFNCSYNITKINGEFYAPIDAIKIAFGVTIDSKPKKMIVLTLPYIVQTVDKRINPDEKNPIYNSLQNEDFENQKALLYGYIIACKKESELYSVKSLSTGMEIISDKYKKITFLEETKEFLVNNSVDKYGIIDENGQNKVEQIYDSIKVINTNPKLYLVENNEKYGVINKDGKVIVYAEYTKIGIEGKNYSNISNQYVFLNSVIPVQKGEKFGLYDINGEKILDVNYNGIGCDEDSIKTSVEEKILTPVISVEECNGIVVKNGETYDLFLVNTRKLISLKVKNIYSMIENGKTVYYMTYKENEMKLIDSLIKLGYLKEEGIETKENTQNDNKENNTINTTINNEAINTEGKTVVENSMNATNNIGNINSIQNINITEQSKNQGNVAINNQAK